MSLNVTMWDCLYTQGCHKFRDDILQVDRKVRRKVLLILLRGESCPVAIRHYFLSDGFHSKDDCEGDRYDDHDGSCHRDTNNAFLSEPYEERSSHFRAKLDGHASMLALYKKDVEGVKPGKQRKG